MSAPKPSVVPAVLDALVELCRTAPELDGVTVVDGPPTSDHEAPVRLLIIGGSEDPDDPLAVTVDGSERGLGPRQQEAFVVLGDTLAWDGGADASLSAVRTAASGIVDALAVAIARDSTLGGLLARATVAADRSLGQNATPEGAGAAVRFQIRCLALP